MVDFVLATIVGTISLSITMVLVNYVYAIPLYARFMNYDISKTLGLVHYLAAMVAPFNLIRRGDLGHRIWVDLHLLQPILKNMKNKQQHWAKASFALLIFVILGYVIRFYPQQLTGF